MAKKKGIERTKTDKSIKADHSSQNIIQTVRVVVKAPKEPPKRKRKSKSKSSSKGATSVSKKEAIVHLQTVMTKFRALKDQAQKMGIKLPISIGESKFVPADIKTVADIQGLIAELRIKNSQIEALIQSPTQSGLSSQLPQQESSFAPQIVEKSEPAKVTTPQAPQAPQVSRGTDPMSDKDIETTLNSVSDKNVPKVSDREVEDDLKTAKANATDPGIPGELNVEIDSTDPGIPGELNVEIDSTEQGTTTIGADGREETLAKMAEKANQEAKAEQEARLKMNQEDALKFQLVRDKANQSMTDEELKADLTGNVDETIAQEGLEPGPKVVKEAIDKLESIEIDTLKDDQDILSLIRVISKEADDAQRDTAIQPEIVEKIKKAYRSETMKDYDGSLKTYADVEGVLKNINEFEANKGEVQDVATEDEVQNIIDSFDKPIQDQAGFVANRVELEDKKPKFRSLQTFLGDTDANYNEFTYLQMIGSLKDEDIVFSTKKRSLSQRVVTKNVIDNTNKFLLKLAQDSRAKIGGSGQLVSLEPVYNSQNPVKYSDFIESVQSKVKAIDRALKESKQMKKTLPSVPTVPQSDPEKVANLESANATVARVFPGGSG